MKKVLIAAAVLFPAWTIAHAQDIPTSPEQLKAQLAFQQKAVQVVQQQREEALNQAGGEKTARLMLQDQLNEANAKIADLEKKLSEATEKAKTASK